MHTKQWLSKARYMAKQRFARMWGNMAVWFIWRLIYEVVGSSIRSILYLGKQDESYKSWYVHPLACWDDGFEGVVDRNLASSPRVSVEAHKKETLESNQQRCIYYYEAIIAKQHQEGNTSQHTMISHLPSRAVTNRVSEVSIAHDDTSRLQWFRLFSNTTWLKGY